MGREVVEFQRNATNWANVVEEIVKIELKIFPKHESLARSFDEELRKKNSGLLYIELNGEVAGYLAEDRMLFYSKNSTPSKVWDGEASWNIAI
ncbi:hypothetical protein SADUNF_Sadunf13G0108900 [Salix dunnii]|uniref:Uncharacterized protein n=1 Tax=Salix dunnii TaxID=1413687 RepID=A0A835JLV3_9ROSI|nr:hypothetical protein SADUNF_Sadunf13G0108900 [Salix dunnii]